MWLMEMEQVQDCPDCGFRYTDPRYHMMSGCLKAAGQSAA